MSTAAHLLVALLVSLIVSLLVTGTVVVLDAGDCDARGGAWTMTWETGTSTCSWGAIEN